MSTPRIYENATARNAAARARAAAERNRLLQQVRDLRRTERNALARLQREREAAKPVPLPCDARALYRAEKAASIARNASKVAARDAEVRAWLANDQAERDHARKGGRPKSDGSKRGGLALRDFTSDPVNALANTLDRQRYAR